MMTASKKIWTVLAVLVAGFGLAAAPALSANSTTPNGETPELGRAGALKVGTSVLQMDLQDRAKITMAGALMGRLPRQTRTLSVRLWHPVAAVSQGTAHGYQHTVKSPGRTDLNLFTPGTAITGGALRTGERYPLVVLSHGYLGWASHFSTLGENLASKGYIVASIDHDDAVFDDARSFQMSFGNVMMDRTQDQRQVITQLLAKAAADPETYIGQIDPEKIALIGYSMGGFGALATAGAPYDTNSKIIKGLPRDTIAAMDHDRDLVAPRIKALVALAPWGGQPDNRSWTQQDLARITAPVLMISGAEDDVVDFDHGVSWLFDHLTGSDRTLLVYQAARHNIAGNPVPISQDMAFSSLESYAEPVWRTERLNQINQHFITAFLDLHLKGDMSKAAYLNVPTGQAADGEWPSALGEQLGGRFADAAQPKYWRGFQRRWAMGLSLHSVAKGATGTLETKVAP
jgi:predicted dienelactone hydrolase